MAQPAKGLIVITGASSGIGRATAIAFSKLGHPVLLLARRVEECVELKLPNSLSEQVDVTDLPAFEKAVEKAEKQFGPVSCLVNNAGVILLGHPESQGVDEWKQMFDINVMGVLNGTKVVLKKMCDRKTGTVINISSIAGRKTFGNHSVYCGTKFAVHAMTENMREEVSKFNVRVIVIAPGVVETELLSHTTDQGIKGDYENWKKQMGSPLQSVDVANAIIYAYNKPQNVCIREIVLAGTAQQT